MDRGLADGSSPNVIPCWVPEAVSEQSLYRAPKSAAILVQVRQRRAGPLMQALARQAVAEIAHGLSTGLVVWAGSAPCAPTLVCASCPDCQCSCQDGARVQPAAVASGCGFAIIWLVVALGCGLCMGFAAGRFSSTSRFEAPRRAVKGGRGVVLQLE